MSNATVTLHVPADMKEPITYEPDLDTTDLEPLHVDSRSYDVTQMSIYADYHSVNNEPNGRADMLAKITSQPCEGSPCTCELLELSGDLYVICDKDLADHIVKVDTDAITKTRHVMAFRSWAETYAADKGISLFSLAAAVREHLDEIYQDASEEALAHLLADRLGLDPEKVMVIGL